MKTIKLTQYGIFSLSILVPLTVIFFLLMTKTGFSPNPQSIIPMVIVAVLLFAILMCYKLTIRINDTHLSFKMGIGIFAKKYQMTDIASCTVVKNSIIYGVGVHMIPNGWLYNVSGLKAIELRFKNKKGVIRIGTNRPELICEIIAPMLIADTSPNTQGATSTKKLHPLWLMGIVLTLIAIPLVIATYSDTKASADKDGLTIKGIYGITLPYADITSIDTLATLPPIEMKTNGFTLGKTQSGHFRLADKSNVRLFIKAGNPPYIRIQAKGQETIYLNFENRQSTIALYNSLMLHQ